MPRLCTSCARGSIARRANVAPDKSAWSASFHPDIRGAGSVGAIGDMGAPSLWLPETSERDLCRPEFLAVQLDSWRVSAVMMLQRTRELTCRLLMISIAPGYCCVTSLAVDCMNSQRDGLVSARKIAGNPIYKPAFAVVVGKACLRPTIAPARSRPTGLGTRLVRGQSVEGSTSSL